MLQPPIVVIHGRQLGFGASCHVALAHRLLCMCRPHLPTLHLQPNASHVRRVSRRSHMAQTLCDDRRLQPSGNGRVGCCRPALPPFIFYRRWRSELAHLIRLLLPHRTVWPAVLCAQLVAAPVSSLCLKVHFQRVLPSNSRHGSLGAATHVCHVSRASAVQMLSPVQVLLRHLHVLPRCLHRRSLRLHHVPHSGRRFDSSPFHSSLIKYRQSTQMGNRYLKLFTRAIAACKVCVRVVPKCIFVHSADQCMEAK